MKTPQVPALPGMTPLGIKENLINCAKNLLSELNYDGNIPSENQTHCKAALREAIAKAETHRKDPSKPSCSWQAFA
jgi:hypothetical protein